jgi:hypothetical protein
MTTVTAITTPVPSSSSPATFEADADTFLGSLPDFQTQINLVAGEVNYNATNAHIDAAVALQSKTEAAASAQSALGASGASKWLSATVWAEGAVVWSPTSYQSYRRTSVSPGADSNDPGLVLTTRWVPITVTIPGFVLFNMGVI